MPEGVTIEPYDELGKIPFFNQDVEELGDPAPVQELKEKIREADAVLLEYDYAIPGILTSALDWGSRPPAPLRHKPLGIMGGKPGWGRDGTGADGIVPDPAARPGLRDARAADAHRTLPREVRRERQPHRRRDTGEDTPLTRGTRRVDRAVQATQGCLRKEHLMADTLQETFPPLPLEEWEDTKNTLHRFAQVVGKIRLALAPHVNHWWHVTLYVTTRGLTTSPMPYRDVTFAIDFDFIDHRLEISTSAGAVEAFALEGLSVARFYEQVFSRLSQLGIEVTILNKPYDLTSAEPFSADTRHASYDKEYVNRYWQTLVQTDVVFKEFSGRFTGKQSPVQLFWRSFDLAITRFSGRRAPEWEGADRATREAYSHEVISFGFWPGDANFRAPAFYTPILRYRARTGGPLQPEEAFWADMGGSSRALLVYDDLRKLDSPKTALLGFLESAYRAGARTAGWDEEAFATVKLG